MTFRRGDARGLRLNEVGTSVAMVGETGRKIISQVAGCRKRNEGIKWYKKYQRNTKITKNTYEVLRELWHPVVNVATALADLQCKILKGNHK
jgi:hypothetical protein